MSVRPGVAHVGDGLHLRRGEHRAPRAARPPAGPRGVAPDMKGALPPARSSPRPRSRPAPRARPAAAGGGRPARVVAAAGARDERGHGAERARDAKDAHEEGAPSARPPVPVRPRGDADRARTLPQFRRRHAGDRRLGPRPRRARSAPLTRGCPLGIRGDAMTPRVVKPSRLPSVSAVLPAQPDDGRLHVGGEIGRHVRVDGGVERGFGGRRGAARARQAEARARCDTAGTRARRGARGDRPKAATASPP